MDTYQNQISAYLADLVTKTRQEQITWVRANPSTFIATVPNANAKITLQRTTGPVRVQVAGLQRMMTATTFVLNLLDMANNSLVLTVTAKERDPSYQTLAELYDVTDDVTKKSGAELLKRIIEAKPTE